MQRHRRGSNSGLLPAARRSEMMRNLTVVLAAVCAMIWAAPATAAPAQVYYTDNFESYDLGTRPALWSDMLGSTDGVITDEWSASPTKSFMSKSDDGVFLPRLALDLDDVSAKPLPDHFAYQATIRMEATATSSGVIGFFFFDPRYVNTVAAGNAVVFALDGKVYWVGAETAQIGVWTPGTDTVCTVRAEIDWLTDSAKVYLNSTLASDELKPWPKVIPASSVYGAQVELDKWGFGVADGFTPGVAGRVFIDDVSLEEYAITAKVRLTPRTINLKSHGKMVTVWIQFPAPYDARDVELETVYLVAGDGTPTYALPKPTHVAVKKKGRYCRLMVKFDRAALQEMLEPKPKAMIIVGGEFSNEVAFEGIDKIRVISPGKSKGNGHNP